MNFIQFETFAPGKPIDLLPLAEVKDAKVGIAICFESVFPNHFRKFVAKGADIMGILTSDAWFVGTTAPAQHLSAAPFRAVEDRISVFRCANGGISCIIDSFGRIVSPTITPTQPDGVLVEDVPLKNHQHTKENAIHSLRRLVSDSLSGSQPCPNCSKKQDPHYASLRSSEGQIKESGLTAHHPNYLTN